MNETETQTPERMTGTWTPWSELGPLTINHAAINSGMKWSEVSDNNLKTICVLSNDGMLVYHGDAEDALRKVVAAMAHREVKSVVRLG